MSAEAMQDPPAEARKHLEAPRKSDVRHLEVLQPNSSARCAAHREDSRIFWNLVSEENSSCMRAVALCGSGVQ